MSTATEQILLTAGTVEIRAAGGRNPEVTIVLYTGRLMSVRV
ncbi:MAG: hypothetical protein KatS3mg109_1686 [Pirellulaceae bacterium]|nr:MAG: hypothetical protein KatS3mg109_1686 [Pirellulaceae bacterium]